MIYVTQIVEQATHVALLEGVNASHSAMPYLNRMLMSMAEFMGGGLVAQ